MSNELSSRLYHANFEQWNTALTMKYFSDRELGAPVLEDGIILPARRSNGRFEGGVCDRNGKFVTGLFRSSSVRGWGNVVASYPIDEDGLIHSDEDVIFGGVMMGHFGHFISECLIRLWYVVQHPESTLKVAFIVTVRGWQKFHHEHPRVDRNPARQSVAR